MSTSAPRAPKASLVGLDGCEIHSAAVPTIWERTPTGAQARPQDMADGAKAALASLLADAPAGEIVALGVTGMG